MQPAPKGRARTRARLSEERLARVRRLREEIRTNTYGEREKLEAMFDDLLRDIFF